MGAKKKAKLEESDAPPQRSQRREEWLENAVLRWSLIVGFFAVLFLTLAYAVMLVWPDTVPTSSMNCSMTSTYSPEPSPASTPSAASLTDADGLALEGRVIDCSEKAMPAWVLVLGPVLMVVLLAPELMSFYGNVEVEGKLGEANARMKLAADTANGERLREAKEGVKKRARDFMQKTQ